MNQAKLRDYVTPAHLDGRKREGSKETMSAGGKMRTWDWGWL